MATLNKGQSNPTVSTVNSLLKTSSEDRTSELIRDLRIKLGHCYVSVSNLELLQEKRDITRMSMILNGF